MSTVIDHAIAIPTKQQNVWEQISNISNNPVWQADCEHVALLTTMHSGRGVRWRNTSPSGREYVIEITAWYEGLGYEYIIVDGVPYKENRGRIRLQEAPEGTVVQWTFTYEVTGFLSGLRNPRRGIENDIIDSLRNLYNYMKHVRGEEKFDAESAKSFMRDAPDVEARAQYQPRHPTVLDDTGQLAEKVDINATDSQEVPAAMDDDARYMPPTDYEVPVGIVEPPVADDDTHPNPTVQDDDVHEPAQLSGDSEFKHKDRFQESDRVEEPSFLSNLPPQTDERPATEPTRPREGVIPEPPIDPRDTGAVSVFDIFGMQKPSETQEMRAMRQADIDAMDAMDAVVTSGRRRGLRLRLREKRASVRLP